MNGKEKNLENLKTRPRKLSSNPSKTMKFLFLDTETTGLINPRLVELAYSFEGESAITQAYFKPPIEIHPKATEVHGISIEMLEDCHFFENTKDKETLQKLLEENILVAHNLQYDKSVLENEGLIIYRGLCTVQLARTLYPSDINHKLQTLKEKWKISCLGAAHSAIGDVQVLKKVFSKMMEEFGKEEGTLEWNNLINNHLQIFKNS